MGSTLGPSARLPLGRWGMPVTANTTDTGDLDAATRRCFACISLQLQHQLKPSLKSCSIIVSHSMTPALQGDPRAAVPA